jgi:GNAT superfamily N-acetyltransferase
MARPSEWHFRTFLVASQGSEVVGAADLSGGLRDNTHLADVQVDVLPGRRRGGVGRALYAEAQARADADGRTSLCAEVYVPPDGAGAGVPAYEFATGLGFEVVHREQHLMLDLPVPVSAVADLRARSDATGYEILTWPGACPPEHVEQFCALHTRMAQDVPIGEIDYEPVVMDEERLRARERRVLRSFDGITAVARRTADGVFGGYSQVWLPHGADYAVQDDTLVMPEHRGQRLGTLLKCATLDVLQREHPDRVGIHTDTALDNHAMQATNRAFGYRPVEVLLEVQRRAG